MNEFKAFMKGEPLKKKPNRYEIADIMAKGCYNKSYDELTKYEKQELIRWLALYSPLFR